MDRVQLRLAVSWDCPNCTETNFIIPEKGEDGISDIPEDVTCPGCWNKYHAEMCQDDFDLIDDEEDEDEEDHA